MRDIAEFVQEELSQQSVPLDAALLRLVLEWRTASSSPTRDWPPKWADACLKEMQNMATEEELFGDCNITMNQTACNTVCHANCRSDQGDGSVRDFVDECQFPSQYNGSITLDNDMINLCPARCIAIALERLLANEGKMRQADVDVSKCLNRSIVLGKAIALASWTQLKGDGRDSGLGWSRSSSWREAYILGQVSVARNSLLMLISEHCCDQMYETLNRCEKNRSETRMLMRSSICKLLSTMADDSSTSFRLLENSLYRIDMGFIMGGPTDFLQRYVDLLDGLWKLWRKFQRDSIPEKRYKPNIHHFLQSSCRANYVKVESQFSRPCPEADPHLSTSDFRKRFFDCDEPCVFRAYGSEWCTSWNNIAFLHNSFGHRYVPLEVGKHDVTDWHETVMRFGTFIEKYLIPSIETDCPDQGERASECEIAYLAQHPLLEQCHELKDDFRIPHFIQNGELNGINAWPGQVFNK